MKRAVRVLPHVTIVMAGMMIVFFLIDRVNTPMGFMANEFHKWLSFLLALACMGYSVAVIGYQRYQDEQADRRRRQARRAAHPDQAHARPPQGRAPQQGVRPQMPQSRPRPDQSARPARTGARPAQGQRPQDR